MNFNWNCMYCPMNASATNAWYGLSSQSRRDLSETLQEAGNNALAMSLTRTYLSNARTPDVTGIFSSTIPTFPRSDQNVNVTNGLRSRDIRSGPLAMDDSTLLYRSSFRSIPPLHNIRIKGQGAAIQIISPRRLLQRLIGL